MTTETMLFKAVAPLRSRAPVLAGCKEFCACDAVCVCDGDTVPVECLCTCDLHTTCDCNPHRIEHPGEPGHSCRDK
jgi:hypothetical protein